MSVVSEVVSKPTERVSRLEIAIAALSRDEAEAAQALEAGEAAYASLLTQRSLGKAAPAQKLRAAAEAVDDGKAEGSRLRIARERLETELQQARADEQRERGEAAIHAGQAALSEIGVIVNRAVALERQVGALIAGFDRAGEKLTEAARELAEAGGRCFRIPAGLEEQIDTGLFALAGGTKQPAIIELLARWRGIRQRVGEWSARLVHRGVFGAGGPAVELQVTGGTTRRGNAAQKRGK